MLDLVPLAGAGWQVADLDRQPRIVGKTLQLPLPQTIARAIAAAAVGRNVKPLRRRVRRLRKINGPFLAVWL